MGVKRNRSVKLNPNNNCAFIWSTPGYDGFNKFMAMTIDYATMVINTHEINTDTKANIEPSTPFNLGEGYEKIVEEISTFCEQDLKSMVKDNLMKCHINLNHLLLGKLTMMAQMPMIPKELTNLIKCEMPMYARCIFGKVTQKIHGEEKHLQHPSNKEDHQKSMYKLTPLSQQPKN